MIGVVADPADQDVVREFFELFKTPWEFYNEGRSYDVLLCGGEIQFDATAKLVAVYAGKRTNFDKRREIPVNRQRRNSCILRYQGSQIPLYGESITFEGKEAGALTDAATGECVAFLAKSGDHTLARIGYNLFTELRTLLSVGQPPANAAMPALELHITLLRNLIIGSGINLVEIPPIPEGFPFIVCLTHDVDHPFIRPHRWDHTMVGFLYRAMLGSLSRIFRGQIRLRDLLSNWHAALKLPFIYMGLTKDFWEEFTDRYLQLEQGFRTTYFVLPFRNCAGKTAPLFRAAKYGAKDIAGTIGQLVSAGHEVGLHGIDAWIDSTKGVDELQEIRRFTGVPVAGVRMHWLYYGQQSPGTLERAGASYDSTVGYNETVGYRAGTSQVYRPLGASKLLELPMHVMDTALFYPSHLALSPKDAAALLNNLVDKTARFGGCLTVNWHDRSLAPDRLWGSSYRELLQELNRRGAWFATGSQATSWFRKRRSVTFATDSAKSPIVKVKVPISHGESLPRLRLRVYRAEEMDPHCSATYLDLSVDEELASRVPLNSGDECLRSDT